MAVKPDESGSKQAGGRFRKGESGNPAGRPKGSGLAGQLRKSIAEKAPDILEALTEKAIAGDVSAARALLDRICPPLKAEAAPTPVVGLDSGSLTERAQAALQAAGDGDLAPDIAAALVAAVGTLARLRETDELEARIRALEERNAK